MNRQQHHLIQEFRKIQQRGEMNDHLALDYLNKILAEDDLTDGEKRWARKKRRGILRKRGAVG